MVACLPGSQPARGLLAPAQAAGGTEQPVSWYDAVELALEGKGWTETEVFYDRLPGKAKGVVREPVWDLARDSAGMCVRFATNATSISARWALRFDRADRPNSRAIGLSGLDLYVNTGADGWRWLAATHATRFPGNSALLVKDLEQATREYLLYLPLYNGVHRVEIGIPDGCSMAKAAPRDANRKGPILFYGTSITQGAYASRPGRAYFGNCGT